MTVVAPCGSLKRGRCGLAMQDALKAIEGRWKMMILAQLFFSGRSMRLSELKREIVGASQKMLIQQLRAMEEENILERTVHPVVPPKVEYALTDLGRALEPVFASLLAWADARFSDHEANQPG